VIQRLDEVLGNALTLEDLLAAIEQWFGELEDEEAIRCAQLALGRDMRNETAQAFLQALNYVQAIRETTNSLPGERAEEIKRALGRIMAVCSGAARVRAHRLLRELGERQGWDPERMKADGLSRELLRWLDLWPATSPEDPQTVTDWLRRVGLAFNPFGPEAAELDPRLMTYGVGTVFKHIRGKRPVLIFGKAGSGKTAAALLLAYYCEDPPTAPREPAAFPVYLTFPPAASLSADQHDPLRTVAYATAQVLAHYLACRPEDFLYLPESRKHGILGLLSLWAGSRQLLDAKLRQVGPMWGISTRLARDVTAMYREVSYDECLHDYPDLLAYALPRGFDCTYLLLDMLAAPKKPRLVADVAKGLRQLLNLTIPLAAKGIYIKFFLPDTLRPDLGDLSAYEVTTLIWSPDTLAEMLNGRIRAANGDSLTALCRPDVPREPDVDARLAQAANGSPRQLVRLGNELLRRHVEQSPDEPRFSAEEIDSAIGPLKGPA
jgi:hypothetical protein